MNKIPFCLHATFSLSVHWFVTGVLVVVIWRIAQLAQRQKIKQLTFRMGGALRLAVC